MLNIRNLAVCGALVMAMSGAANAQILKQAADNVKPEISVRGGGMLTPRFGGLAGIDFAVPTISLSNGWQGRLDADVIFKANFAGVNTIIPVTIDQIMYTPSVGGHTIYYGAGVGAVLGGSAKLDGKLILGTELTSKLGAEANVHFTTNNTLVTVLVRLHL